jgi:hypothetical protein
MGRFTGTKWGTLRALRRDMTGTRHPLLFLVAWVVGGAAMAAACGGGSHDVGATSDAGAGEGASASSDAGAADDPRRPAAEAACAARAQAYCDKLVSCFGVVVASVYGDVTRCAERVSLACVPTILANGSQTTADDVRACAAAIPGAACDAMFETNAPPAACRPKPGTLTAARGATCAFDAQCAGARCPEGPGGCGVCSARSAEGGDCRITHDCDYGLLCAKSGKCRAPGAVSSTCGDDAPCAPPAGCLQGSCIAAVERGEICDAQVDLCDPYRGLYCDPIARRCAPVPVVSPGHDCSSTMTPTICAASSSCTRVNGSDVCVLAATDGAACDGARGPLCTPPAICNQGRCVVLDESSCR